MAETADALRLDEQICFALYRASRSLTARYRELLAPLGVTYPQYLVLLVLWERGTSSVSAISEHLDLDSGTLSPLVRRLEKAGLVVRTRRVDDERSVEVSLTQDGYALHDLAVSLPQQICLASGIDVSELRRLTAEVRVLAEHVRLATAQSAGPSS